MKTKTRFHKLTAWLLTLAMLMTFMPGFTVTASAAEAATDLTVTIDTGASVTLKDADGDGYYDIGTADDLYAFAAAVNGGNDAGVNGELTANIVVNRNVLTADGDLNGDGSNFRVWTPIGFEDSTDRQYFEGLFDGNNYTVSGLYYNGSAKYVGLFGYGYGATIRNVGIIDSYMCSNYSDTSARGSIGGVVASFNYDNVSMENCYNKGTIIATTDRVYVGGVVGEVYNIEKISNSYNTGKVVGKSYVGGIVGYATYANLIDCYNTGAVSGDTYVGGIVGYIAIRNDNIEKCYNTGNINCTGDYAGGIVAYLSGAYNSVGGAMTNCYNTGNVNSTGKYAGGLAGYSNRYNAVIQNSYNIGAVSGINCVGGVVGENFSSVQNCYNLGDVSGTSYIGGISGESNSAIQSCYNAAKISGGTPVGGIVGNNEYQSSTQNCYYLTDTATGGIEGADAVGEAEVKTAEQFKSGEVAYLLQGEQTEQLWGQIIGSDTLPVFATASNKVYLVSNCQNDTAYSNTQNEGSSHIGGLATCTIQAVCTLCGESYGELADHTGGTATCKIQAVCEVCEESYGELDPNNHEYEKNNGICCDTYQPAVDSNSDGYYEIASAGQLFWFANHVNTVDRTASAVLTADIDLENRPWTPIGATGEKSNNFRGHFDGDNHTITNLYIDMQRAGLGFFGEVRLGIVENFTIYGDVKLTSDCSYVGGVIGSAPGANGTDVPDHNGATIRNITSYVNVTLEENAHGSSYVGGFMGYANHETIIENCSWYGTLDLGAYRADSGVGGLVGRLYDGSDVTIRNCAAYGTIKTSYKSGTYENYDTIYIGGLLSFSPADTLAVLENNLWAGKFIDETDLGNNAHLSAFGTLNGEEIVTNCYALDSAPYLTTENVNANGITTVTAQQLASGEVAYLLGSAWGQDLSKENSLPVLGGKKVYYGYADCNATELIYSNSPLGDATATHSYENGFCSICDVYEPAVDSDSDGVYEISNAGQLYWFAQLVNNGTTGANGKLMKDIKVNENVLVDGALNGDGSNFRAWTPIGYLNHYYDKAEFVGIFDGNGHIVSGLYFNHSEVSQDGLFGIVGVGGVVKNVGVIQSYFACHNAVVGGVVGVSYGTVQNCYNTGTVSGYAEVGGVIGFSSGTITGCYNTGTVRGEFFVGGVVGNSYGTVQNCYYLTGCAKDGSGTVQYGIGNMTMGGTTADVESCTTGKTEAQFASGEVAYLLGDAWGQDLSKENILPALDGAKVYKYTDGYSNELKFGFADYTTDGAVINIPTAGTYSLIFADYDGTRLNTIDIVPVTVTADTIGEITQTSIKGVNLDTDDKIMLWQDMTNLVPLCEAYIVK